MINEFSTLNTSAYSCCNMRSDGVAIFRPKRLMNLELFHVVCPNSNFVSNMFLLLSKSSYVRQTSTGRTIKMVSSIIFRIQVLDKPASSRGYVQCS